MNYADIKKIDVANGYGIRVSLFVSGCRHKCKGCFNSEAWDFKFGNKYDENVENTIIDYMKKSYIKGLSILGGEPLEPENQPCIAELIKKVKEIPNKDIWLYTGFRYEELVGELRNGYLDYILNNIDILVDGKFELEKKDLTLKFRGSSNQRIIDIKNTNKDCISIIE